MKRWLEETHGTRFELFRHFLGSFFHSDVIAATGQTTGVLIGAVSLLLPSSALFVQPLKAKYAYLSKLPVVGPYRDALRADELWMIALVMAVVGALTAIKWQSLFPGSRDYRALAGLPVRAGQLFLAKGAALLVMATAVLAALLAGPAMVVPLVSGSRWSLSPALGPRMLAHAAACAAGSYFFFFGLIALQGALLNVLPRRGFARVSAGLQAVLLPAMVVMAVLSFSVQPQMAAAAVGSGWGRRLPPVWFLGLHQAMLGDPDAAMQSLAQTARTALWVAFGGAVVAYLISYRRHRALAMEGTGQESARRQWQGAVLEVLIPNPRQQAIVSFMGKTLMGSGQHRMILTGYGGLGVAILLSLIAGMRQLVEPERVTAACFVYGHVVLLVFLLLGVRHLFAMPVERGANWIFRITEREGRREWMRAVDRLTLGAGAAVLVAAPFPLEAHLLGWRAPAEAMLFGLFGLLCYEWAFSGWEKLPFTCSYLPGKTPSWVLVGVLLGLLSALPLVSTVLVMCLYNPVGFVAAVAVLGAGWLRARTVRRETWGEVSLQWEEMPAPAIRGLDLMG